MTRTDEGFTAVELLITLFVAVAFIATAYQLYTVIIKDSGEARFRAKASNVAYAELRRWSDDTSAGCTAQTTTNFTIPSGHGLDNPAGTVTVTCRTIDLARVETVVTYGPTHDRKVVRHAVYIAK